MRRTLLLLYCLSFPLAMRAEVIDRIAAVVDGHIITTSDMRQQREIRTKLGDKPIEDDAALLQHMIDDYLIETNMTDVTIDVTDDEINAEMRKFGPSSDFPLAKIGEAVRLRIRMQKYFDKRSSILCGKSSKEPVLHSHSGIWNGVSGIDASVWTTSP